jgi:multiple antibiotic resistance protein
MHWPFALQCSAALLAILNPIGALPLYLTLTAHRDRPSAERVARKATVTVFAALAVSALIGQAILRFFGITIPAFRVGGGILVLLMAVSMLQGRIGYSKQSPDESADLADRESVAVVPLGIPILAGPGSISTAILLAQKAVTWPMMASLASSIVLATTLVYLTFRIAQRTEQYLGRTEIGIVNRVMGLILAAVAVQFITDGLRELFPMLGQAR